MDAKKRSFLQKTDNHCFLNLCIFKPYKHYHDSDNNVTIEVEDKMSVDGKDIEQIVVKENEVIKVKYRK